MKKVSPDALVAEIPDGATVAVMKDASGAPMALARALIRRGVRGLHLACIPTGGFVADILIGAGCVATVEGGGVTLGEYGQAPNFVRAVKAGTLRPLDSTCPAMYTAIQAAQKGIPFMPIRGLIGSDILKYRDDYKIAPNPFAADDPIVLIPALAPDFALVHAPLADKRGNLWVGRQHELRALAQAAKTCLATVEALHEGDLTEDPLFAAGIVSSLTVAGVAVAPDGARPCGLIGEYEEDRAALAGYVRAAETEAGFGAWLDAFLELDGAPARAAAE